MKCINIYLEDHQTEQLDIRAAEHGISRAELLRRIIDEALSGMLSDKTADLAAIRESFGVLKDSDVDFPVRSEDGRSRHLDSIWNAQP